MMRGFALCCLVCLQALLGHAWAEPKDHPGEHRAVVTLDWTVAETLIAMGAPPDAAGELRSYDQWVRVPKMPDAVLDLGMRAQPNLEQLQRLQPALIINSDMFIGLNPVLAPYGTIRIVELYPPDVGMWQGAIDATRTIGDLVQRPDAAQALVDQATQQLEDSRQRLAASSFKQVLVMQFIDSRRVRVYGQRSIFSAGLERLGLQNAWPRDGNRWGFQEAGLDELAQLDADTLLVVVKPFPQGTFDLLAKNRIWRSLPVVRADNVVVLDAIWGFGGVHSIARFGQSLTDALLGHEALRARSAKPPANGRGS